MKTSCCRPSLHSVGSWWSAPWWNSSSPGNCPIRRRRRSSFASTGRPIAGAVTCRTTCARSWRTAAIWLSIVGLSVFWGISQVVLAAFPAFAKEALAETNTVVIQGVMACSGIGIIIGSMLAGKASRRYIETGLIPLGAFGVVGGLLLIPQLSSTPLLALDFLLLGIAGGLFIVPLNTLIQFHARDAELGTILAGNNWMQNLTMLGFLGLTLLFALYGINAYGLFHILTLTALAGAVYTVWQLPQSLVRYVIGRLFASTYRIEVLGFENLPAQGGVLMLGNHISWLDWAMLQIACPRPIRFVMYRAIYQRWYLKGFLDLFGVIPIAGAQSKEALQQINTLLKAGEVVCLFPEGAISRNGQLGEFKRGYERTVEGVEGVILPFYLRGLWGSRFSRSSLRLQEIRNTRLRGEVILAFGKPLPLETPAPVLKQRVFDLSIDAWEQHTRSLDPVPLAWLRTAKRVGGELALADVKGETRLSGYRTITAVLALSRLIRRRSPEQNIGLLLPTSSAGIITNMAALLLGKTLVNLNYTASLAALQAALDKAEIRSLYTSQRFLKKLAQRGMELSELLGAGRGTLPGGAEGRDRDTGQAGPADRGGAAAGPAAVCPVRAARRTRAAGGDPVFQRQRRGAQGRGAEPSQLHGQYPPGLRCARYPE